MLNYLISLEAIGRVFLLSFLIFLVTIIYFSTAAEAAWCSTVIKAKNSTRIVTYSILEGKNQTNTIARLLNEAGVKTVITEPTQPEEKVYLEKIPLRVLTYNIAHGEQGLDKILDLLKASQADVIALNEVDNGMARSEFVAQAAWLANELGMHYYFGPAKDMTYGNAVLSHYPILEVNNIVLPSLRENRGCLTALVQLLDTQVRFFITHLGLRQQERFQQIEDIKAFMDSYPEENKLLLGDFNAKPFSPEIEMITANLLDAFAQKGQGEGVTYPAISEARIDYIFVSPKIGINQVKVLNDQAASDHYPVLAQLEIEFLKNR